MRMLTYGKYSSPIITGFWILGALPGCFIAGHLEATTAEPENCVGATSQSCEIPNGFGEQTRTCEAGAWSSWSDCTFLGCNSGYLPEGSVCVRLGTSRIRLDGGLAAGSSTFDNKMFEPLLPYVTPAGVAFDSDEGVTANFEIDNTVFDRLYQNETWVEISPATIQVPVENGAYSIHLHFVDYNPREPQQTGDRVFHVDLEGERVLPDFDIIAEAGKYAALVKSFDRTITDGAITITFTNQAFYAEIAALEILPKGEAALATTPSLSSAKEITLFQILGINGAIGADTIHITVPYGTTLTSLVPTITHTGVGLNPASGVAQDFTLPVTYTVTAEDDTTRAYVATVDEAPPGLTPNYFVDQISGDDGHDGTSPSQAWKTLNEVNSRSFSPGDVIGFKRGCVWHESLTVPSSGEAGNPIVFTTYGDLSSPAPIISGFVTVAGWVDEGNGVRSKSISCDSPPNVVTFDGNNQHMGRWPNHDVGYATVDSHTVNSSDTNTSITDAALPVSPNFTGGEVVIKKYHWHIDNCAPITHADHTLSCTGGYPAQNGYGYFVQDHRQTLDQLGEWYYDGATFYMYFGAEEPGSHTVRVGTIDNLISVISKHHITFDGLRLEGANQAAVRVDSSASITVQSCDIDFSGRSGVLGVNASSSPNLAVLRSTFDHCNDGGLDLSDDFAAALIGHNRIRRSGMLVGMGQRWGYNGIYIRTSDAVIEHNTIYETAYCGIWAQGNDLVIRNNYVYSFCQHKDDGAGIYVYSPSAGNTGRQIYDNIVLGNGMVYPAGAPPDDSTEGIYIDDWGEGVVISRNTCAFCNSGGIYLHHTKYIVVEDNTLFDNQFQMLLVNSRNDAQHWLREHDVTGNIFFAKSISPVVQRTFYIAVAEDNVSLWGDSDYNWFARPIDDDLTIRTQIQAWNGPTTYRSLESWRTYSGDDAHSQKSPVSVASEDEILFYLNETTSDKTITLPSGSYRDVKNVDYSGSVVLAPFTSIILTKI